MARTIVLPGRENFPKSVDPAIPLEKLRASVDASTFQNMQARFGSRPISTWGFTPTLNNEEPANWTNLNAGDRAIFTGHNTAFAVARVFDKVHEPEYARQMWGPTEDGRVWEYVILLENVHHISPPISYADLNPKIGYSSNFVYPGALLLTSERSAILDEVLKERGIPSDTLPLPKSQQLLKELEILATLESPSFVQRRREQQSLRRYLLNGSVSGRCAICGDEYSADLLIAAHIKRRADCTHEERLDFQSNTMLLCTFGCDALFERQYLTVGVGGKIAVGRHAATTTVRTRQQSLAGRTITEWTEQSRAYFVAHAARLPARSISDDMLDLDCDGDS